MNFTTKSFEELSEEQISNLLVLMKSKGRNSYKYLSQENVRRCRNCGEVFEVKGRGRPKKFCCDACRLSYNHAHPQPVKWKSTRVAVCPLCGKNFLASREYGNPRKYCSHACANRARAAARRNDDGA